MGTSQIFSSTIFVSSDLETLRFTDEERVKLMSFIFSLLDIQREFLHSKWKLTTSRLANRFKWTCHTFVISCDFLFIPPGPLAT